MNKLLDFGKKALFYARVLSGYEERRIRKFRMQLEQRVQQMESDHGKLFIGGMSRDTGKECLKEYFATYGEVIDAVIMGDRATGRAREFGLMQGFDSEFRHQLG